MSDMQMVDAALDLAARGWHVGPLHESIGGICTCREGIKCKSKGKHPRTAHGFKDFSRDPEQIRAWWRRDRYANVGGATGEHDGHSVVVLDLDLPKRADDVPPAELAARGITCGANALAVLCEDAGQEWPATRTHESWSGAMHLIFRAPAGIRIPSTTSVLGWKVDVKADKGMITLPPSVIDDRPYFQRTDDGIPQDVRPLPNWLLERIREKPRPPRPAANPSSPASPGVTRAYVSKAIESEWYAVATCKSGRNDQLARSAYSLGQFVGAGLLDRDAVHQALTEAAERAGIEPTEAKAQNTIRRSIDAGSRHPRSIPERRT